MATDATLAQFRSAYYKSGFFENLSLDAWQEQASPQAGARLRHYTLHLLEKLEPPEDSEEIAARGSTFIEALAEG